MADPLEETISLSDMTDITETEDPRATQHGSTLGTDLSGQANQLEGGKSEPGDTEVRKKTAYTPGEAGCDMDKRDPRNRGRSIWADIDDTTRQQPIPAADSGRPSPKPDVRRFV